METFSVHSSVREIVIRLIRLLYKGLKVFEKMKHIGKVSFRIETKLINMKMSEMFRGI